MRGIDGLLTATGTCRSFVKDDREPLAITAGGKADAMNKLARVFSASILLLGCLAGPSFAKDDIEVDIDGLCEAAYNLCAATCHLRFPGSGFSDQLSLDLCVSNCSTALLACGATEDDVILRQNSRGKDAIKKLKDLSFPKLSG